jgi:hypothetical protein
LQIYSEIETAVNNPMHDLVHQLFLIFGIDDTAQKPLTLSFSRQVATIASVPLPAFRTYEKLAMAVADVKLSSQIIFIRDLLVLLKKVSTLVVQFQAVKSVDDRGITDASVDQIRKIQKEITSMQGKPDSREIFKPCDEKLRCTLLDGIFDGNAAKDEAVRQTSEVLKDMVSVWLLDAKHASETMDKWTPAGFKFDASMLTDAEMQTAMLQNKQYHNIEPACAALTDMADKLEKLNEGPDEEKLCDVEAIARIRAQCDKSSDVVTSTYVLPFVIDRLPYIEDVALRKAEIDNLRLSLTASGRWVPSFLEPALARFCSGGK